MSLTDLTVTRFIEEVDSPTPAPGGGSVSAYAGVMGIALARMVGHLTIPKKAYKKLSEEDQQKFTNVQKRFGELKELLFPLIEKDTEAFNQIMNAYKLPKETEKQIQHRLQQIELATIAAIDVPMQVATFSLEALVLLDVVERFGNKNCLSDIGVSALQLNSACQGALMNVRINASSLQDNSGKAQFIEVADNLFHKANILSTKMVNRIYNNL